MTTKTLLTLVQNGYLASQQLTQAMAITAATPQRQQSLRLLDILLLSGAVVCACAGVILFFAYNWDALGRLQKFVLAQATLVLAFLPLFKYEVRHLVSQIGLFAGGLLLGALLALIGQTYQTGADAFELFLLWALLLLPWIWLGRSKALAVLFTVLLNISLLLAFTTFSHVSMDVIMASMLAMNLVVWSPLARLAWINRHGFWLIGNGLLLAWIMLLTTFWAIDALWDTSSLLLATLSWAALVTLILLLYLWRSKQMPMLLICFVSVAAWLMSLGSKIFPDSWMMPLSQGVLSLLIVFVIYYFRTHKNKRDNTHADQD